MACDLAAGRALPCKDGLGGIKEVLWCVLDDVTYAAISAGAVADITSTTTFYRWVLTKNSGSFQQNITSSVENGTVYYEQVLTIQTPVLEAAVSAELANVNKNRLSIVVRDVNDNFHIMGYAHGAEVTGGTVGTGTAKGDLNGYNVVFTAEEEVPAPHGVDLSDSTVVGGLTGTVTISPTY
jgi:hypothetical protein